MIAWVLVGCALPPGPGTGIDTAPSLETEQPRIGQFDFLCDVDANRYSMLLVSEAWAGGVTTFWTVDGLYIERHRVDATSYAEDGSAETFELSLAVSADWRLVVPTVSTAFPCASDVDVIVALEDFDGSAVDCRLIGPNPERWAEIPGIPPCKREWP